MDPLFHEEESFENLVLTGKPMKNLTYENCIFVNCDLSVVSFSFSKFIDCTFTGCNLSMAKLAGSQLKSTLFTGCKVLGVNFADCSDSLFSVSFDSCILDFASFACKKMVKTSFRNSSLKNADFSECDLSGSLFINCDLDNAVFNRTILKEADFRTAINFNIDPENNNIRKAKFSLPGLAGLLYKHNLTID
jgi:fluoroquinolone resistance protein